MGSISDLGEGGFFRPKNSPYLHRHERIFNSATQNTIRVGYLGINWICMNWTRKIWTGWRENDGKLTYLARLWQHPMRGANNRTCNCLQGWGARDIFQEVQQVLTQSGANRPNRTEWDWTRFSSFVTISRKSPMGVVYLPLNVASRLTAGERFCEDTAVYGRPRTRYDIVNHAPVWLWQHVSDINQRDKHCCLADILAKHRQTSHRFEGTEWCVKKDYEVISSVACFNRITFIRSWTRRNGWKLCKQRVRSLQIP